MPFLYVGAGGAIGSVLRYLLTLFFQTFEMRFPFGTLTSNCAGCFIIGVVTGLSIDVPMLSGEARLFLATGICGGFTTLSSLVYELGQLFRDGQYALGSLYFVTTFFGAFGAFFAGITLIKIIYRG
jgi:CrcB protein